MANKTKPTPEPKQGGKRVLPQQLPLGTPYRRELMGVLHFFLGLFLVFSLFTQEALFVQSFSQLLKGLVGVGAWLYTPMFFLGSYILLCHRGRPVLFRLLCTYLLPISYASLSFGFVPKEQRPNLTAVAEIWKSAQADVGCGVLGTWLGGLSTLCFTAVGTVLIFFLTTSLLALACCNRSVMDIIDWIAARPLYDYQPPTLPKFPSFGNKPKRSLGNMPEQRPAPEAELPDTWEEDDLDDLPEQGESSVPETPQVLTATEESSTPAEDFPPLTLPVQDSPAPRSFFPFGRKKETQDSEWDTRPEPIEEPLIPPESPEERLEKELWAKKSHQERLEEVLQEGLEQSRQASQEVPIIEPLKFPENASKRSEEGKTPPKPQPQAPEQGTKIQSDVFTAWEDVKMRPASRTVPDPLLNPQRATDSAVLPPEDLLQPSELSFFNKKKAVPTPDQVIMGVIAPDAPLESFGKDAPQSTDIFSSQDKPPMPQPLVELPVAEFSPPAPKALSSVDIRIADDPAMRTMAPQVPSDSPTYAEPAEEKEATHPVAQFAFEEHKKESFPIPTENTGLPLPKPLPEPLVKVPAGFSQTASRSSVPGEENTQREEAPTWNESRSTIPEKEAPTWNESRSTIPEKEAPTWNESGSTIPEKEAPTWNESRSTISEKEAPTWNESGSTIPEKEAPTWNESGSTIPEKDAPTWNESGSTIPEKEAPTWNESRSTTPEKEAPTWNESGSSIPEKEAPTWDSSPEENFDENDDIPYDTDWEDSAEDRNDTPSYTGREEAPSYREPAPSYTEREEAPSYREHPPHATPSTPPPLNYIHPPLSLLRAGSLPDLSAQDQELQDNRQRLEDTLRCFSINASIHDVTQGPSVTRYEVMLEQGVKLNKLTNLSDDISLALGATGVRIAPIPDKISMVGIEVPNRAVTPVEVSTVLGSANFLNSESKVSFAVGKDISNNAIVGDIGKMPHLLVAGTTGSGKSVCTNSLIISLLYKASPEEVRLIMVDPKMVELQIYNGIPHLLIPVVTDPKKAAGALQWAVTEMLKRYKQFSDLGVRDLASYNAIAKTREDMSHMPQVVVVIDELADLMLVAAKEVEESICRVAQMGRASGMHLIVATQRPSADVITGLMKANIPSRISFAVSSGMESRIILDTQGAEKLVGRGDMLYAPLGGGKPARVQGCLITDAEVSAVVNFVKEKNTVANYSSEIMEEIDQNVASKEKKNKNPNAQPAMEEEEQDVLFDSAVELVMESGQASTTLLQRRLKVGYNRAARIVESMEDIGILGPLEGAKGRQILISKAQWQEMRYLHQGDARVSNQSQEGEDANGSTPPPWND